MAEGDVVARALAVAERGLRRIERRSRELAGEYARAELALSILITTVILASRLDDLRERRRRRQQAHAIIARLEATTGRLAPVLVEDSFALGQQIADQAGGDERGLSRINREALDLLTENLEGRLADARRTVGRRVDDVFRREGLRLAAAQISREQPVAAAAGELRSRLARDGVTAFVDKAGRRWGLENYAEMAVKTVTSEAIAQATQLSMLARGFDIVRINSVTDPCPVCKSYDGGVFSLTGRSDRKQLDRLPPFHPRCRHFILPAVEAVAERRAALARAA